MGSFLVTLQIVSNILNGLIVFVLAAISFLLIREFRRMQ